MNRRKNGKLYGIGIGPGDPKLLTLKAKEILDRADIIFCPKGDEDGTSWARSFIETTTLAGKKFVELPFPMTRNKKVLKTSWQKAAKRVAEEVYKGKQAAFITLGDPFIYSTYVYLLKILRQSFPDMEVETVPGISAFNAAAARAQIPLVQGDERMAILPVTKDLRGLREAFQTFDTVVLMKVGSKLDKVTALLAELNLLKYSILVSRVGQTGERMIRDLSSLNQDSSPPHPTLSPASGERGRVRGGVGYLSVIIVKIPRKRVAS